MSAAHGSWMITLALLITTIPTLVALGFDAHGADIGPRGSNAAGQLEMIFPAQT